MSVGSIAFQLPFVRLATPARRREWARIISDEHARAEARRARVLAHPDIARRLVDELGYAVAEQWTGFVPPGGGESPRRSILIDILRAVAAREAEGVPCEVHLSAGRADDLTAVAA